MIDQKSRLNILHDDNSVFTDYSHKMTTFGRDALTLTLTSIEDYIYVGFDKPINSVYVDITTQNGSEGTSAFEYYNGTTYIAVDNASDDTLGLYRSGFIQWDKEQENQAKSTVNSIEMYWYRIKPSVDRTAIAISGIGLVFSDDYELSLEQPYINGTEFLGSESSHIKTHTAVRNEIIQKFRNKDYIKYNDQGEKEDINIFDLHDIHEIRMAATYLALSKIYFQMSDNAEDIWYNKSQVYEEKFIKYINIARLSLDTNDDGVVDIGENKANFQTRFMSR